MNEDWPSRYQVEMLRDSLASAPDVQQFGTQPGVQEGLLLQVTRADAVWVGNFQRGAGALDKVAPTPSPDTVCVVAGGRGYWVRTDLPSQYEIVRSYPIQDVIALTDSNLLVFVDFTELTAYGVDGFEWITERVSWDGISVLRADRKGIIGKAWDATSEKEVGFHVDPITGRLEGGAAPPTT